MEYLNEISQATKDVWLTNFNNAANNIFVPFQSNTILPRSVYEALSNNNQYNIRLYMGLTDNEEPRVIAMSSYYHESGDSTEQSHTDLIIEGKVFELYTNEVITIPLAKDYINNWKVNLNNNLFKFGFLIPRSNVITLFEELGLMNVRLFFGIDENNEIKLMMQKPDGGNGDVIIDNCSPCPNDCSKDTRMFN